MKSQSKNRFKKINHHLKSKQIDEKLEMLNEIPTNNISNYFVVEPDYYVQDPAVPGEVTREANFTQDSLANGRDTTGLFDDDGTILTIEPPGDTSYILGPMASMWYAWGNFTTIGYIRQADRRMVDLGRISGPLGSWNGSSGFTSYGQLTLEQAVWFKNTPKLNGADNDTPNYRAFYPGPPSNSPDQYGRYLCVVTGTPKPVQYTPPKRRVPPVNSGPDPNLPPGSANPFRGTGMAMLNAMDSDMTEKLLVGLLSGALWALELLKQIGVSVWDAIQVLQSKSGERDLGPDTDNDYQRELQRKAREQSGPRERSVQRSDSPQKQAERDAADKKLKKAEQEVKDAEASGNKERIDRAYDNYDNAVKNRQRVTAKQRADRKAQERSIGMPENVLVSKSILTENRQRIIRDLKKPVVLPEAKKEKIKHRPKVIGAPPKTINSDLMKKAEVPSSYIKPEERLWGKYEKDQNAKLSQERKNEVLDHLGGSDHAWEWLTETSRQKNQDIMYGHFGGDKKKVVRKEEIKGDTLLFIVDENGKKESILQSELSIKLADEFNKELFEKYFQEQETLQADKDPLFRRVSKKLKTEIDYPDKPSKAGYPNDPPPEMVNGWHPEYGQDRGYYNKLDPQSAESMPPTDNPQIDSKVSKAKRIKNIIKGS
jgi:hypothetical protein